MNEREMQSEKFLASKSENVYIAGGLRTQVLSLMVKKVLLFQEVDMKSAVLVCLTLSPILKMF